jgi:uncharacterized integral membrane protein
VEISFQLLKGDDPAFDYSDDKVTYRTQLLKRADIQEEREGEEESMQVFFWLAFLVAIGVAIFAVQNSTAPSVEMKFLFWNFGTSLPYTLLILIGSGMLVIPLLWIPRTIRSSF